MSISCISVVALAVPLPTLISHLVFNLVPVTIVNSMAIRPIRYLVAGLMMFLLAFNAAFSSHRWYTEGRLLSDATCSRALGSIADPCLCLPCRALLLPWPTFTLPCLCLDLLGLPCHNLPCVAVSCLTHGVSVSILPCLCGSSLRSCLSLSTGWPSCMPAQPSVRLTVCVCMQDVRVSVFVPVCLFVTRACACVCAYANIYVHVCAHTHTHRPGLECIHDCAYAACMYM